MFFVFLLKEGKGKCEDYPFVCRMYRTCGNYRIHMNGDMENCVDGRLM